MHKQPKTARAVHANRGIEARYKRRLKAMVEEMNDSIIYWLTAAYRKDPPKVSALVAEDASPFNRVNKAFKEVSDRWLKRFEEMAPKVSETYLNSMFKATDKAIAASFKDAGWAITIKLTPAIKDAYQASLAENVGLIKSIPEKYLQQVQGVVSRSYASGFDLQKMVKDIKRIYPVTERRAVLIARDQSNKANAVINRTRQLELGITEAIWMHSYGGKEPRKDHLAADGKKYNIADGCKISGEYIQPGEEINCRCTSRPVLPTVAPL